MLLYFCSENSSKSRKYFLVSGSFRLNVMQRWVMESTRRPAEKAADAARNMREDEGEARSFDVRASR